MVRAATALFLIACSEPPAPVEPEAPPAVEPAPVAEPPTLEALGAPSVGKAILALPTLGAGWEFPVSEVAAGFGKDETMVLLQLGDEGQPRLQLTWLGALAIGSHPVQRDPEDGVFAGSFHDSPMRVQSGTLEVTALDDEHLAGTVDIEVRHPLSGDPTRLRARFDAARDRFHDASIAHQRAIRGRLERR